MKLNLIRFEIVRTKTYGCSFFIELCYELQQLLHKINKSHSQVYDQIFDSDVAKNASEGFLQSQ